MTANALPGRGPTALTAFFFWSSWAASTDRPGKPGLSYTSNWPHEPLVGNQLTGAAGMWTIASIILLLAGIAGMVWYARSTQKNRTRACPSAIRSLERRRDAINEGDAQVFLRRDRPHPRADRHGRRHGALRGGGPGVLRLPARPGAALRRSRTMHTQVGVLWIATAWLATGLYIAPLLSG